MALHNRWIVMLATVSLMAGMLVETRAGESKPPIGRVRDIYDGTLNLDVEVNTFRHIDEVFPSRTVPHGASPYPLPKSSKRLTDVSFPFDGRTYRLSDYLTLNRVTGLLVLKNGKIALEDYRLGNTDRSRWVSWSIVKSISSTLLGAAIKDGYIKSLDDQITAYLPQLVHTSYDGVSVRNLVQMASGVGWDETYTNPRSDRRHMLEVQIAQRPGAILQFVGTLPRVGAPGTVWNYSTGETHVFGSRGRETATRTILVRKDLGEVRNGG